MNPRAEEAETTAAHRLYEWLVEHILVLMLLAAIGGWMFSEYVL